MGISTFVTWGGSYESPERERSFCPDLDSPGPCSPWDSFRTQAAVQSTVANVLTMVKAGDFSGVDVDFGELSFL